MKKLIYIIILLTCLGIAYGFADENTLIPQLVFHDTVLNVNLNDSGVSWTLDVANTEIVLKTLKDLNYCSITFDDFLAFKNGSKQLCDRPVILVFDDGRKSTYTLAYPLMKKYGFVGNMAIIAGKVGISNAFMSWAEINFLEDTAKWLGVCHSVDHVSMTSLNTTNAEIQYVVCTEILYNNTGHKPNVFVFPYYSVNDNALQQCLQYYTGCATNTSDGYMQKNIPLSKGFYRTTLDGLQKQNNVAEKFLSMLPYKTVNIISNNVTPGNIVKNPGFDGKNSWTFYTNGKGSFTASGKGIIKIITIGTNTQLYQYNIPLTPNTNYNLSFYTKSEKSADMGVRILKHTSPYNNYGLDWKVDLTNEWKEYSKQFKTNYNAKNDARLMFWMTEGTAGETYSIDNIRLVSFSK
ncbi:TPA: polysaccharide deacetylase family protein [Candidatus Woesearchaeota archaeon]|nr:polysaccharide deacetylase family protein [Candidatus Woesearchaeota archaeon]